MNNFLYTVDPGDYARANSIPISSWSVINGALTAADGTLDEGALRENFGFCVQ